MAATVTMYGDRKLARQLERLIAQTPAIAADTLTAWGKDVRDDARKRVPVRTGALRSGITYRIQRLRASVGTHGGPFYGEFVENGTSRQAAQPFLHPAAVAHSGIRQYVRVALDKHLPS